MGREGCSIRKCCSLFEYRTRGVTLYRNTRIIVKKENKGRKNHNGTEGI